MLSAKLTVRLVVCGLLVAPACVGDDPSNATNAGTDSGVADAAADTGLADGSIACEGGLVCGGACVDVTTDAKNCGRCGHDCLGGSCVSGACTPVVLASSQGTPINVVVDGKNVYWTNYDGGQVMKCAKDGCNSNPTPLASNQDKPRALALDPSAVYWTNQGGGQVSRCDTGGCGGNPTVLVSGQNAPFGIAVGSTRRLLGELPLGGRGDALLHAGERVLEQPRRGRGRSARTGLRGLRRRQPVPRQGTLRSRHPVRDAVT